MLPSGYFPARYSSTGGYYPIFSNATTTTGSAWTYSSSGTTTTNTILYNYGFNPGYDAPDYDRAGRATDQQIRDAMLIPHLDVGRLQSVEERQRANEERRRVRVTAEDRATGLLLSVLTPEQQEAYRRDGSFEVLGSCGGRYRINRGSAGNVEWLDPVTGRVAARLCAHPTMRHDNGWIPDQDVAVAQMLSLMTDEAEFVRVANVHAGRRPTVDRTLRVA